MTVFTSNIKTSLLLGALTVMAAGCAYMPGAAPVVEADFGNSVRNMVRAQTYDLHAAENPQEGITEGLDGAKAEVGLKGYRKEGGEAKSVQAPIKSVGGN